MHWRNYFQERWIVCSLALAGLVTMPIRGAVILDTQTDSSYQTLAARADFAPVGIYDTFGYSGCAILVASDWVLTSAHLVLSSGGTFTLGGQNYISDNVVKHAGWNGDVLHGDDVALVHLTSAVTAVPPAMLYTGNSELGRTGTFVGFGMTGTGLTGWASADMKKRAYENVIDGTFDLATLLGCDFDNPHSSSDNWFGSAMPLSLEGCSAPGDSGGGVFIEENGSYYLAGLVSGVLAVDNNPNSDYGDITAFTRLSAYNQWIGQVVPEPGTATLTLLSAGVGLLSLGFGRRR